MTGWTVRACCGLALAASVAAEDVTPAREFRSFDRSSSRGLPQSTPMAMAQDEEGVLWIATLDGLATFDGTSIQAPDPLPGAPRGGSFSSLIRRVGGGVYAG